MTQTFSDQQLIQAFRLGGHAREKAWEYAFKQWYNRIVGVIAGSNGTREEAKDAIQEVVMAFERRITKPDFELKHQLSTYFISCVYRQWMRRKKQIGEAMMPLEDSHLSEFVESVELGMIQDDLSKIMDDALDIIGERCKKILRFFMNGFSMKEIAEFMGFAGGEQVAKNEKNKCQSRFKTYLLENPGVLAHIQQLRHG